MSQAESWKLKNEKDQEADPEQDEVQQEAVRRAGWKALFTFTTKKHLLFLTGALISGTIAAISLPAQAIMYGLVFNQFANFGSGQITGPELLSNVSKYCVYMAAIAAIAWFFDSLFLMLWLTFGELQARSARDRVFNCLLMKDMAWYDTRRCGIGAFLPTLQMQVRDLQLATSQPMGEGFQSLVTALSSIGMAFYYSWDLTLVTICTVPIVYLVMAFLSSRLSSKAFQQGDSLQEALKYLTTAIQNIEMVKCFNGEQFELDKYGKMIARAEKFYNIQANLRSIQLGAMQFITLSMFVQGFWYGSSLVVNGKRSAAHVVTTFWAALLCVQAVTGFLPQLIILQKGQVAGARLQAMMAQIQGQETDPGTQEGDTPSRCIGDIEFKQVSFSYPSLADSYALRDATIFFPAGETTFVIGRSGSGKSTLGQLLVRFYEPTAGEILIDGIPLRQLDVHWLRKNVTLLEQHSVLFSDTLYGNIALAKWDDDSITAKDIRNAATFAHLDQMLKDLPDGLQTIVGLKGNGLSGGQKQRVALARAHLRDTPILILDESTCALDYVTRMAVLDALRKWRKRKTTIIITHDISQIHPDDFVCVLDNSRVVQEGYRRTMKNDESTPFNAFRNSLVLEKLESLKREDDTDELLSYYASSCDPHVSRRNSRTFFEFDQEGSHSERESLIPQMISPFWGLVPNSEESHGARRPSMPRIESGVFASSRGKESPVADLSPVSTRISNLKKRPAPISRPSEYHCSLGKTTSLTKLESHQQPQRRREKQEKQEQTPKTFKTLSSMHILKTVWPKFDWKFRLTLMVAVFAAAIHAACTPAFSFVFARLLATFYAVDDRQHQALLYALVILGISITNGAATYAFHFLFDYSAQGWINKLKLEAYERLLDQPRKFFDLEENNVSRLAETLDNFAEEARNILGRFIGVILVVAVMTLIAVVWSLISCWKLTLLALGSAPIIYGITAGYKAVNSKWESYSNDAHELVGTVLYETFVNIRTVRCLVLEEAFRKRYRDTTEGALRIGLKRAIYTGSFFGLNYSAIFFLAALLFWYGAKIVSVGDSSTTNFIQAAILLLMSASYCNFIINLVPQIGSSKDGAARLLRLSNLPKNSHEHAGTGKLPPFLDIILKDVNFAYPSRPDQLVLKDVSFNIPPGSCIAIVGASGSGKSTVASLLLKLYQTDANRVISRTSDITIMGRDIKSLNTRELRSSVAIVSQTPVLFPGTIADNISYGLSPSIWHSSLESIRAAAIAAGIDEFISSLPLGYQTLVGEGGTGLSGGQAQRIAIARALVRQPDALILDEATSALDVESAGIVRDTIQRLVLENQKGFDDNGRLNGEEIARPGMTIVIITHAREMMKIADRIIMLDRGRVVEEGGFEELKGRRGAFAMLLRSGESGESEELEDEEEAWADAIWKGKGEDSRS
ncbi:P-loop containing nucleoside triphosphate hydrolase protein [Delitschia confertaspora ATCC 74209]|uniref:P-loop containing nucleoside triphosphate hydrolase protein n=1 Tax=Delitschia confertaspora ATCC 74209 TaxID=1513339 RepID=A0A9P4JL36_9PLEO|nr:P-loop containing nucleoside triphosphate hydrolase protein [Delitschia confertaspora ATCC 74209]